MNRVACSLWGYGPARSSRCVDTAILAIAAIIVASLLVRSSGIYAEALPGPVLVDNPAGEGSAAAVDLEAIRADAQAITAIGRSVYEESDGVLDVLVASGFPDEEVHAEAISALKRVARLSYHLASTAEVLVDTVETASAGQLTRSGALAQAQERLALAERAFDQSANALLKQIRVIHSHESSRKALADEIARQESDAPTTQLDRSAVSRSQALEQRAIEAERSELQGLIRLTRPYEAAQTAVLAAISQLVPLLAPPVTRDVPEAGISLSVYGFLDPHGAEEDGYGLYTYVLLAQGPGVTSRNVRFLRELFATTQRTRTELAPVRRQLNIFYVPTRNRIQALVMVRTSDDAAAAIAAPAIYDYEQAERLLFRLCTETAARRPNLCASAWRGPYLLTLPTPATASAMLPPTRLLLDLSNVHERAFGEFIGALKEQVMRPDFVDRQKIDTVRLGLLDITLKAADWLNPIKEGIAEIVSLGVDTAR